MTKFIASIVLAASVLAGVGAAQAMPEYQVNSITPHGVFDGR